MITVAIIIVLVEVASLLSYVFSAKNSSVRPTEATTLSCRIEAMGGIAAIAVLFGKPWS